MKKYLILFFVVFLIIILFIGLMAWKGYQMQKREVLISTDKTEYEPGEILRVKIKNDFGNQICFSSCYPYYLERKNEKWESYKYVECHEFNGNGHCLKAGALKAFELTLSNVPEGPHRLAIPVCIGCKNEDPFREDARFYSNEFSIKEKKVEEAAKNCNEYQEMPMTQEEIEKCACPEGYEKFYGLSRAYCATNSQKPCKYHTDCPEGEGCMPTDGKSWRCTGRYTGCFYNNPENPEEMICAD